MEDSVLNKLLLALLKKSCSATTTAREIFLALISLRSCIFFFVSFQTIAHDPASVTKKGRKNAVRKAFTTFQHVSVLAGPRKHCACAAKQNNQTSGHHSQEMRRTARDIAQVLRARSFLAALAGVRNVSFLPRSSAASCPL